MRKTFIIASTGDRVDGLSSLIISLTPFLNEWKLFVICQCYSEEDAMTVKKLVRGNGKVVFLSEMIGPHSAKMIALNNAESDVWCSLDDDMVALPETDYNKIADILAERKDIGFISGNWARTAKQASTKAIDNALIKQKLVYTGGGLLFRDDVAEIIRNIPNEKYLFDDCLWSMYAYINGYDNYRYTGSIAIHKICTVGGRKTWLKKQRNGRVLPPSEYLVARPCNDLDGYYICIDSDLTETAKQLHDKNRELRSADI